ncbi:MAG: ATP-dependent zinc metalloprotease FtsH [Verrucomicrobia bacterium]|nr:ATP-dependent zinc metalloprotease FtsH [Verrucomicrobiota bacterium]
MAQNDPRKQDKNSRNLGNDNNFNWRGILLFACAIALLGGFFFSRSGGYGNVEEIPYTEFQQYLNEGRISKDEPLQLIVTEGKSTQILRGAFDRERKPNVGGNAPDHFKTTVFLEFDKNLKQDLESKGYKVDIRADSDVMIQALLNFAPVLLIFVAIYFFFRQQIRNAGKGALSFGKSKARMLSRDRNRVTFKDVAGVEEAKEEVQEIVDFLKDPKKFQKLGGRIPKGVLMVGPPGTGKTLLARAIAGEADVPFYSISGSDFVEMFVGVGASRVRDMFEQGKKSAPCIIFIDEIDAVGRHRGHGLGGGHDEREQTLNALLVEMDGFDTQEGVIIIAATNRPDVLDPALLRPGRFDRQITVNLPDVKGREEILRVHAKRVKLAEGVDLAVVARGTPGYSGAELANVINEAALLAARRGLKAITMPELEEARDKVRWGKERRSLAIGEKEKENTAYHEAGHALLCEVLEHTDPVHKVTIIPRGPSLGSTMYLPVEDRYNNRKNELLDRLVVIMGGRVAEEMVFGDVTSGASGDIRMGTGIARKMVCEWGMSERLGMVEYGEHEDYVFLGRDISRSRAYSEATAQEIDREVKRLCDDAYQQAMKILTQRKETLIAIAKALLEYETLDGSQVREIINHGRLLNPPPPIPPVKPSEPRAEGETIRPAPEELGGLTEAPA